MDEVQFQVEEIDLFLDVLGAEVLGLDDGALIVLADVAFRQVALGFADFVHLAAHERRGGEDDEPVGVDGAQELAGVLDVPLGLARQADEDVGVGVDAELRQSAATRLAIDT